MSPQVYHVGAHGGANLVITNVAAIPILGGGGALPGVGVPHSGCHGDSGHVGNVANFVTITQFNELQNQVLNALNQINQNINQINQNINRMNQNIKRMNQNINDQSDRLDNIEGYLDL